MNTEHLLQAHLCAGNLCFIEQLHLLEEDVNK